MHSRLSLLASFSVLVAVSKVSSTIATGDFAAALVEDDECHTHMDHSEAVTDVQCALELTQLRASKLPSGPRPKIAALVDTAPFHLQTSTQDVLSTTAEKAGSIVAQLEADRKQLFLKEMTGSVQDASSDSREGGSQVSAGKMSSDKDSSQMFTQEAAWKATFEKALASPERALARPGPRSGESASSSVALASTARSLGQTEQAEVILDRESASSSDSMASPARTVVDYGHPAWLSSCQTIFLDLGATLGVNARKVFEPKKYPDSTFLQVLDGVIGEPGWRRANFSKTGLCVLGLEPNPEHQEHLAALEQAYEEQGWMVHFYDFAAWSNEGFMAFNASSERPTLETELTSAGAHLMMHATEQQQGEDDPALMVRTVDLAVFINSLPQRKVDLMVMDIEGAEYETLARLIQRSLLCERRIRTAFVSTHEWGEIGHWGKDGAFLNTTHPRSFTAVLERRDQLQGVQWCNSDNVSTLIALPDDSNYTQDVDSSFTELTVPQIRAASAKPEMVSAAQFLPFQLRRIPTELGAVPMQATARQATSMLGAAPMQATPRQATSMLGAAPMQATPRQATSMLGAAPMQVAPRQATSVLGEAPLQATPRQATSMLGAPMQIAPMQATSMLGAPMQTAPAQTPMQSSSPQTAVAQASRPQTIAMQASPALSA